MQAESTRISLTGQASLSKACQRLALLTEYEFSGIKHNRRYEPLTYPCPNSVISRLPCKNDFYLLPV